MEIQYSSSHHQKSEDRGNDINDVGRNHLYFEIVIVPQCF